MTPLNLSGRRLEVRINGDDWTPWVTDTGVEVSMADYDVLGGLILISGKFTLQVPLSGVGIPHPADPRGNRNYWGRGARVNIKVADEAGILQAIPAIGAALYIAKSPQQPFQDTPSSPLILEIPICCRLTLENFPEPIIVSQTGIVLGADPLLKREEAVENLLDARGLESSITSNEWGYTLEFPVARTQSSETPIQFAGAIAAVTGRALRWLSLTGLEQVIAENVNFAGTAHTLNFSATGTVERLQPSGDLSEQPAEKTLLEAIYLKVTDASQPVILVIEEEEINPNGQLQTPVIVKRTEITTTRTSIRTEISEALYKITGIASDAETLTLRSDVVVDNFYYGANGSLSSQRTRYLSQLTLDALGGIGFDLTNATEKAQALSTRSFGVIQTKEETANYSYDSKLRVSSVVKTKKDYPVNYISDYYTRFQALNQYAVDVEVKQQTWKETQQNVWLFKEDYRQLAGLVAPDKYPTMSSGAEQLVPSSTLSKSSLGNTGQDSPPATQYIPAAFNTEEIPLKYLLTANLGYPAVTATSRTRKISLDHIVSIDQLVFMGNLINKFIVGRSSGFAVVAQLEDFFLSADFRPFCGIQVIAPTGTYNLAVGSFRFVLTQKKSYIGFLGIAQ
jgi:hypothetical protein